MRRIVIAIAIITGVPAPCHALEPRDVYLIVNKNAPSSRQVAEHYCKLRQVPTGNIVELDLPTVEDISREDYDAKLVKPLRAALQARAAQVKVLLSVFGVPLRVGAQTPSEDEQRQLTGVRADLEAKRKQLDLKERVAKALEENAKKLDLTSLQGRVEELKKEVAEMQKGIQELEQTAKRLGHEESTAAVDSELMLLWWPVYPTDRWLLNSLHWQMPAAMKRRAPSVVMTCRLDGPTPEIAKRLVADAVWAEERGLKGKVYVDARGIPYDQPTDATGTGYGGYDESMREMAALLKNEAKMEVKLDDTELLFDPHSCPDTALYCGWYAVRQYTPCCKLNRGSVAWHLASFEMVSLRNPQGQWCGNLLRDGACATIGPVAEPYSVAFPKPEEFFGFLVSGEYTLVECYARTTMLTSWMMCLVGDPLYNPYKNSPKLKSSAVWPSPKGSKGLFGP
jgi:uncharacterized protein (TIGR03790 family)